MRAQIHRFLDIFYPLFRRFLDKTTYYYAVAGSTNLVLGWVLFWVLMHAPKNKIIVNKNENTISWNNSGIWSSYNLTMYGKDYRGNDKKFIKLDKVPNTNQRNDSLVFFISNRKIQINSVKTINRIKIFKKLFDLDIKNDNHFNKNSNGNSYETNFIDTTFFKQNFRRNKINVILKLSKLEIEPEQLWLGNISIKNYSIVSIICSISSFLFGFIMMRFVVFVESQLKGHVQFFRYGLSALISATVNWLLIKLMVDTFDWNASLCNVFASVVVVTISYFLQRKFSFR